MAQTGGLLKTGLLGPHWVPVSTRKGHVRPQRACTHSPGPGAVSLCTDVNAHPATTPWGLGRGHCQVQVPGLWLQQRG